MQPHDRGSGAVQCARETPRAGHDEGLSGEELEDQVLAKGANGKDADPGDVGVQETVDP